jgi:hypothetical protein
MNPTIQLRNAFYLVLLLAVSAIPFALAQRNATSQGVAKLGSTSKGLVKVGNALPANIIVVTNTNDSGPGSLRDALATANDGDMIDATGVSGTILLTSGELQINHNVTINGPGAGNLAVNGNATSRVFENFASNVTISGLTISNGLPTGENSGGGGILNHFGLTLSGTSILSNNAGGHPPFFAGGGGINSDGGETLTVTNSTISDNSAGGGGGGIFVNNMNSGGTVTVTNSTISDNSAGGGGGIWNVGGTITVTNSTISANSAPTGGGILNDNGAVAQIGDTILNAGASGGTITNNGGTFTSLGYNLASDDGGGVLTGPGDQINTDPVLGPLQDNGGPTFTHALLPGSPAIDAGDPNFTPPPFDDQRGPGFPRVVNGRIDKGSFEVQSGGTPTPTPTPTPTTTPTPTATPTATPTPTPIVTPRVTPRPRPTPHPRPTPRL